MNDTQTPAAREAGVAAPVERPRAPGAIARDWWRGLQGLHGRPDRASLAQLRRCATPMDAALVPAFHALRRRLPDEDPDYVAATAIVLAHVRADVPLRRFAQQLAPPKSGAAGNENRTPEYKRFRSLLQSESPDELIRNMSRAVAILSGKANVSDLAGGLLRWYRDETRRRWAFAFFDTEFPVATSEPTPTEHEDPQ